MSARCLNCGRPGWIGLCILCSPASESATTGCTGSVGGECCDRPAHTDCALAGPSSAKITVEFPQETTNG